MSLSFGLKVIDLFSSSLSLPEALLRFSGSYMCASLFLRMLTCVLISCVNVCRCAFSSVCVVFFKQSSFKMAQYL